MIYDCEILIHRGLDSSSCSLEYLAHWHHAKATSFHIYWTILHLAGPYVDLAHDRFQRRHMGSVLDGEEDEESAGSNDQNRCVWVRGASKLSLMYNVFAWLCCYQSHVLSLYKHNCIFLHIYMDISILHIILSTKNHV